MNWNRWSSLKKMWNCTAQHQKWPKAKQINWRELFRCMLFDVGTELYVWWKNQIVKQITRCGSKLTGDEISVEVEDTNKYKSTKSPLKVKSRCCEYTKGIRNRNWIIREVLTFSCRCWEYHSVLTSPQSPKTTMIDYIQNTDIRFIEIQREITRCESKKKKRKKKRRNVNLKAT